MAYSPSLWADRIAQNPGQFAATGAVPGNVTLTLSDNPTQGGTSVTAARMNNIENELVYLDGFAAYYQKTSVSDLAITVTTGQLVATLTPTEQRNFEGKLYLRVTATATVTANLFWTDASGNQGYSIITGQSLGLGSYNFTPVFFNSVASPIVLIVTASVANVVYASAAIVGV